MILHIDDMQTVADVQDKFSRCFPGLKVEFYKMPHLLKETSLVRSRIEGYQLIGAIRKNHEPGNFEVMSWYTVARLEREFRDRFGLYVQVFRNENGVWLQTANTNRFTLLEQMEMAAHAKGSIFLRPKKQHREYEYL